MYFFGTFSNLSWNSIAENQRITYSPKITSITNHIYPIHSAPKYLDTSSPLDFIAMSCVNSCMDVFFPPLLCAALDISAGEKQLIYDNLKESLQDHLIMTFAYRFYCQNLEPLSFTKYCRALFEYNNFSDSYKDPKDYRKENIRKYNSFYNSLTLFDSDESSSTFSDKVSKIVADKELFSHELRLLLNEIQQDRIPGPSIWFLNFLANNRLQIRKILSSPSPYSDLSKLLMRASLDGLLNQSDISPVADSTANNPAPVPTEIDIILNNGLAFAGIPTTAARKVIPPLEFTVKGSKKQTVKIGANMQILFNNYLFEKYLHLYSLASITNTISSHVLTDIPERLYTLLNIFKLNAPLVQCRCMDYLANPHILLKNRDRFCDCISYWNDYALPLLEECFILSVKRNYNQMVDIFSLIEKSFSYSYNEATPNRYERMNLCRLILPDQVSSVRLEETPYEVQRTIIRYAFVEPLTDA